MLEMREREGSDVLGAHEDRGKGGTEASKHSAEVDASQVRQGCLAAFSRKPDPQVRRSQEPFDEDELARCLRGDARAAVQERKEMRHKRSYREQRPHRWW